jgi:hypothetical protein
LILKLDRLALIAAGVSGMIDVSLDISDLARPRDLATCIKGFRRTGNRFPSLFVIVAPNIALHRKMPSLWWRSPMPEVGDVRLALIEPIVNFQIVLRHTAEESHRAHSVMIRVG